MCIYWNGVLFLFCYNTKYWNDNRPYADNRNHASIGKLWRKFSSEYDPHAGDHSGTVYFERRRGRGI